MAMLRAGPGRDNASWAILGGVSLEQLIVGAMPETLSTKQSGAEQLLLADRSMDFPARFVLAPELQTRNSETASEVEGTRFPRATKAGRPAERS